jgi:hypothetical protein
MRYFYALALFVILIFSGCSGASDENPTITLKGDRDITLKVGQVIREPGYSAYDPQDGDITDRVQVTSNLNFYKAGQYYVNYSVKDSDGNVANASRVVTVTNDDVANNNSDYIYDVPDDKTIYDFAEFLYPYQVYINGETSTSYVGKYDSNGNNIGNYKVVYERNKNDKSIYKFIDDTIVGRDFISLDEIKSYDNSSNLVARHQRDFFVGDSYDDGGMVCKVVENLASFDTSAVTPFQTPHYPYINVLHTYCNGQGRSVDHYYANGWGEILRVEDGVYEVSDKNSFAFTP